MGRPPIMLEWLVMLIGPTLDIMPDIELGLAKDVMLCVGVIMLVEDIDPIMVGLDPLMAWLHPTLMFGLDPIIMLGLDVEKVVELRPPHCCIPVTLEAGVLVAFIPENWLRLVDFLTSVSVRSLVSPLGDTPTGVLEDALEETPPFALEDSTFLDLFCKHSCS